MLGAVFGMEVPVEGVAKPDVVPTRPDLVRGVPANIGEKEIEAPVAVVVEEDRARRVTDISEARLVADVGEAPASVVEEQAVPATNRRHVQVGVSVVVGVAE